MSEERFATLKAWCHWKSKEPGFPDRDLVFDVEGLMAIVADRDAEIERLKGYVIPGCEQVIAEMRAHIQELEAACAIYREALEQLNAEEGA